MANPIRLGVLLSGGGTTLQNLLDCIADGRLVAQVACVVSSKASAFGLERARQIAHRIAGDCILRLEPDEIDVLLDLDLALGQRVGGVGERQGARIGVAGLRSRDDAEPNDKADNC